MQAVFSRRVKTFSRALAVSGSAGVNQQLDCIRELRNTPLQPNKTLIAYHDALLFACAFPADKKIKTIAEAELKRITSFLRGKKTIKAFINSGMPFTACHSFFSHDFTRWLMKHDGCTISFGQFKNGSLTLNDVLKLTLPSMERNETTAGLGNEELLDVLLVNKNDRLSFLVNELSRLDGFPYIKDQLFESLGIHCDIIPRNKYFSVAYNRIAVPATYFRREPTGAFDPAELLNRPFSEPATLNEKEKLQLVTVIKNSMALKDRETDTVTFMDEASLRLYYAESGISMAVYGMVAERQLPLESYAGYTLFMNGFPAAYGGAWLFGPVANFGINIFETFRGAASGHILCQLLRLYRQVFGISSFEIEPYQFGFDNPDGIKTGAFWFYFRYGFQPKDKMLLQLSLKEKEKIKTHKNYRTPAKTLIKFTESNMVLQLAAKKPVPVADISDKVIRFIHKKYKCDNIKAEADCIEKFTTLTGISAANKDEMQVLKEVSLWAEAFHISDERKLKLLAAMVKIKPADLYAYQRLLLEFFESQ